MMKFIMFGWMVFIAPAVSIAEILSEIKIQDHSGLLDAYRAVPDENNGTQLLKAKKVTVTNLDALPQMPNNEYRQLFSKTPGLLVSEVANQSLSSFNYRGLGDPHETFNLLLLQDGLPIAADPYGYPANYYNPAFDFVKEIEFIRGGAALLYGPMPAGALNYKMRQPELGDAFHGRAGYRVGSNQFHSAYTEVTVPVGKDHAVSVGAARRRADGFRPNSEFDMLNLNLRTVSVLNDRSVFRLQFDSYQSAQNEAGGLGTVDGSGLLSIQSNRFDSTLLNDRLSISRQAMSLTLEQELNAETFWVNKVYGGFYSRESFRQNRGTGTTYGGTPNGSSNTIQNQDFKSLGVDSRIKVAHNSFGIKQKFAGGLSFLGVDSPYDQATGSAPDVSSGFATKQLDRKTRTASLFLENRLEFGKFSVTPGARLENINQSIRENLNSGATVPLRSDDKQSRVPLFGLGLAYEWIEGSEGYFNVSQAYKPVTFSDAVPLSTGDTISEDIKEARTTTYELGARGQIAKRGKWDTSIFYLRYNNQFGRVGSVFQNTGGARHYGWDGSIELDVWSHTPQCGRLSWYGNAAYLNARFDQGTLSGKTPQYAPSWMLRSGLLYYPTARSKVGFMGTVVTDHFADDGNTASQFIPTYQVWDLTAEVEVLRDQLSVVGGINNLFDRLYWSRVRSNGIEPAAPRNFYLGLNGRL